jgi:glycerol kinase
VAPDRLYLALDQGGHATRAIIFDTLGNVAEEFAVPIITSHPEPGVVEHDAEEMGLSVMTAIEGVMARLGTRADRIVSAGFATQRSSVAFWDDATGQPLAPIASWQDRRDAETLVDLAGAHEESIITTTGLRLSPHYGANKLRWFLKHNPAVAAAEHAGTLRCGPMASYLLARSISGCPALADPANASRTLLWDLHRKDWSPELLGLFGIPEKILPRSVPSRFDYGVVRSGTREIPVTVCTGDQSAAIFASGALDMDAGYVNIGTGAFIQKPTTRTRDSAAPLLQSVVWQDNEKATLVLEGTINGAASALVEYIEPLVPDWSHHLDHWLATVDDPPLFMNGVSGLAAPFWVHDFQSQFIGSDDRRLEPPERAVAIAESIVFLLQENLSALASHGEHVKRIVVSGGLANSDALCRRLADMSGCEVFRPKFTEATARGLSYLLRSADLESAAPTTEDRERAEAEWRAAMAPPDRFIPRHATGLQERYDRWRTELHSRLPR